MSQYYGLVIPENRNFQSFKEFFERRDQLLTSILGKPPVHSSTTPFSAYVAEATEWATAHEKDRIKFFLYHHAPNSLKSRIEEYFVEDIKQFKRRIQAIWSHQSDNPVTDPPVNYEHFYIEHLFKILQSSVFVKLLQRLLIFKFIYVKIKIRFLGEIV